MKGCDMDIAEKIKETIKIVSSMPRWECFESKIDALTFRYTRQNGLVTQVSIRTDINEELLTLEIDGLMSSMLYGKEEYERRSKGNKRRARQRAKRKIDKPSVSSSALEVFQL